MEHQPREARGRRSLVLGQVAVCISIFLGVAAMALVPSTEARVPASVGSSPPDAHSVPVLAAATATPLPGQTTLDANTVALYRFDAPASSATDETGRYPGTFNGGASVTVPGLYRGALSLPGPGSFVSTGNLPALSQGTLEAFVDFQSACLPNTVNDTYSIISANAADGSTILQLRDNTGLEFGIYSGGNWYWANSGINACRYLTYGPSAPGWPYETWRFHQVAGTWGPRGLEIWVDGVLHGVGTNYLEVDGSHYRYMCNPQMQLGVDGWPPNPLYPVCQTPVAAPIMSGGFPPGDYTGGIPAASLNIGCGPDRCFQGRIDEVRISNVQRTFTAAVVPTSTPLPMPTPVTIGGENAPNSNTTGLYHLGQDVWFGGGHFTLDSQNGLWDAALEGNGVLTPAGLFGSGMALDGSLTSVSGNPTFFRMNTSIAYPGSTGTFEAWVNLAPDSPDASPFFVAGSAGDDMYFGLYPTGHVVFRVYNGSWFVITDTPISKSDLTGAWHHLAATWGNRGLEVWLDGVLRGNAVFSGYFPIVTQYTAAGCDRSGHCMKGRLDEVRMSRLQLAFAPLATPTPTRTPTPVYSAGPAATAQATIQQVSSGLSPDDQSRLNGLLNPIHRGASQPSGLLSVGQLAMAPVAPTPAPTVQAAIPMLQTPIIGGEPPRTSASPPAKINPPLVSEPLALDSNAIALYRLNSQYGITLSDATGNYPAILFGDATIKSIGADRPALTLNGGLSYAQVNHFASPRNGTVEVWASFDSNPGQMTIVTARQNSLPRFLLGVRAEAGMALGFGLYNSGWQWADSGLTPKMLGSGWHHIAGTYGPRGVEIWIDGILRGANPYDNGLPSLGDETLLIGWSPGSGGMTGKISQIRISNSQRTY